MSEEVIVQPESSASHTPAVARGGFWLDRIARAFGTTSVPFEMYFPDGAVRRFGQGVPSFCARLKNRNKRPASRLCHPGRKTKDDIARRSPVGIYCHSSTLSPCVILLNRPKRLNARVRIYSVPSGRGMRSSGQARQAMRTHVPVLISRWRV